MALIYTYKNTKHTSVESVRQAIWDDEFKIFGTPATDEEWSALGVTISVDEPQRLENPPVEPTLEELKQTKLGLLNGMFNEYRNASATFLVSSLGFRVNANIAAINNVSGLVVQLQHARDNGNVDETVFFMDFDDALHKIALQDLQTIQVELSIDSSNCYAQKWELRKQIQGAKDKSELDAIEIRFKPTDFTKH